MPEIEVVIMQMWREVEVPKDTFYLRRKHYIMVL